MRDYTFTLEKDLLNFVQNACGTTEPLIGLTFNKEDFKAWGGKFSLKVQVKAKNVHRALEMAWERGKQLGPGWYGFSEQYEVNGRRMFMDLALLLKLDNIREDKKEGGKNDTG